MFMRKIALAVFFSVNLIYITFGQMTGETLHNLKNKLWLAKDDLSRYNLAKTIANGYRFSNLDSTLFYTDMAMKLATKMNSPNYESFTLSGEGNMLRESGRLPEAMQKEFEAMNISNNDSLKLFALNGIGNIYMELGTYDKANEYYLLAEALAKKLKNTLITYNEVSNIGNLYDLRGMPDSAIYYLQMVYNGEINNDQRRDEFPRAELMFRLGNAYQLKGDSKKALGFYMRGISEAYKDNDIRDLTMNELYTARLYKEINMPDSSLKYLYSALHNGNTILFRKGIYETSLLLSDLYKKRNEFDSAYKYLSIANVEKDSLYGAKRVQEMQRIILYQQQMQQQAQEERDKIDRRNKTIVFSFAFLLIVLLALYLLNNNRKQKKVNATLKEQQLKISSQNIELEATLKDLKSTQSQLIQSEKMASLGELTAGIAHEIQNPLNFVNNFSEVNKEMLEELKAERLKPNAERDDDLQNDLINDVIVNEEKINHHGKRADAIVKNMLQHSRKNLGQKEPTEINKLADEYLRLSYHGLRAKDKSFNADFKTDFDETIGKINIVPQDIGRVLLNLYNNAFYAVSEKKKQQTENYEPTISVNTKKVGDKILISVTDNGNGIPQNIIDKIFQPFFTTKPTGRGTGLGLSLAYDIITKEHNGTIKVESEVDEGNRDQFGKGEGTMFVIQLPIN
jgi:two-component system NtrC family sensor kinase